MKSAGCFFSRHVIRLLNLSGGSAKLNVLLLVAIRWQGTGMLWNLLISIACKIIIGMNVVSLYSVVVFVLQVYILQVMECYVWSWAVC